MFVMGGLFVAATGCAASTGDGDSVAQAEKAQQTQEEDQTQDPQYPASAFSGRAIALKASGPLLNADLGDTGPLDPTGGDKFNTVLDLNVPGLLRAEVLRAEAHGAGSKANSEAELARLTLLGIQADLVRAIATAECGEQGPTVKGETYVADLVVNGKTIPVLSTGPNQVIEVPGLARIVLNEQSQSVEGDHGEITVTALHVTLLDSQEIWVSQAEADVTCGCGCGTE
jgi:hypothetical protein